MSLGCRFVCAAVAIWMKLSKPLLYINDVGAVEVSFASQL
jgi:hypothetical protein